jgi:hypothetical protein
LLALKWGISETGRGAKFYSLQNKGKKDLDFEVENWNGNLSPAARFI